MSSTGTILRMKGGAINDKARTTSINLNFTKQTLFIGNDKSKKNFNLESVLKQGHGIGGG